jgi:hypothetical protein
VQHDDDDDASGLKQTEQPCTTIIACADLPAQLPKLGAFHHRQLLFPTTTTMSLYDTSDDASFGAGPLQPSISNDGGAASGGGGGGGLGSLADELAALGDDYSDEEDEDEEEGMGSGAENNEWRGERSDSPTAAYDDSGILSAPVGVGGVGVHPTPTRSVSGAMQLRRAPSPISDEDVEEELDEKISAIERLALDQKKLLREEDAEDGGVVNRLMAGLQSLPSQNPLEAGSTRLITAHSALSSHLLNQTARLRDLGFAVSAAGLPPPPDTADLLLGLIELIPRNSIEPLQELNAVHNLTMSLISQLSFLSDSLHMARQSSMAARRKLQAAKEACADWRRELEMVEYAQRWIEDGDWDARCKRREAAIVCSDVTSGFEDVCRGFEEKLRAQELVTA